MPLCGTCHKYYPPDFVEIINEETREYQCHFCRDGRDYVVVNEGTPEEIVYKQDAVIFDYIKFMERLKSNALKVLTLKSSIF